MSKPAVANYILAGRLASLHNYYSYGMLESLSVSSFADATCTTRLCDDSLKVYQRLFSWDHRPLNPLGPDNRLK